MAKRFQILLARRVSAQEGRRLTLRRSAMRRFARADDIMRRFARADDVMRLISEGGSAQTGAAAARGRVSARETAEIWAISALGSAIAFVLWIVLR
jgi:hypothetical protein